MADEVWTVAGALAWTRGYLERKGDANPRGSAQWLLSAATGLTRLELYTNFNKPLTPAERAKLREMIPRRAAGEPLQYISGRAPFRTIEVYVEPGVLIPRPETEVLVGEALAFVPREGDCTVLDLCCGSGCIACAVAVERPEASVVACDIAPEAVALTRKNAKALGVDGRVEAYEGDLFAALPETLKGCVDVIVTNPPYVPSAVCDELVPEVRDFEPRLALDGGKDGLDVFRAILSQSQAFLAPGGVIAVELHETCLEAARSLAEAAGFADVLIVDDLAGKPRVLVAKKED